MAVTEGSRAPDFTLETPDGPVKLADFAGRTLVLYFYPKDDTTGCTNEAKAFSGLAPEFSGAGATVVGVSKDSVAAHRKFADKYGLQVKLASDPTGETVERYGSWAEKSLYGRKYMGVDRSTFLIDGNGVLRQEWRGVKIPGHVEEVLEAAKSL